LLLLLLFMMLFCTQDSLGSTVLASVEGVISEKEN